MTVTNLWNLCGNWTPFSNVRVLRVGTPCVFNYKYFEDALKDWADFTVTSFIYDSNTDTICINIVWGDGYESN